MYVRRTNLQNFLPARMCLGNTNVKQAVNSKIKMHKVILEVTSDQKRVPSSVSSLKIQVNKFQTKASFPRTRTLQQPPQPSTCFLLIYVRRRRDCIAKRNKTIFWEQRPACKFNLLPIKPPHKKPAFTGSHTWLLFMTITQRLDVRLNCNRRKNWILRSRFHFKKTSTFIHSFPDPGAG